MANLGDASSPGTLSEQKTMFDYFQPFQHDRSEKKQQCV